MTESVIRLRKLFMSNKVLWYSVVIAYIAIFIGCASFPLMPKTVGYTSLLIHLVNVVYLVPLTLAALLGKGKFKAAYIISMLALILGMICRYLIEFGEVSNTANFTVINIVTFLGVLPTLYAFTYYAWSKEID